MGGGYCYGEMEPKKRCPYCGALCCADFVDIGVGYQQCGPYHCEACGASEVGPFDEMDGDPVTGWYPPGSSAGSSANVDQNGKHIRFFEADTLYRESLGVPARYDNSGRLIGNNSKQVSS